MAGTESIDILKMKMEPLGFVFEEITLGTPAVSYTRITSKKGNSLIVSTGSPLYPFATASARTIYVDKMRVYDLAAHLNLQIPKTLLVKLSELEDKVEEVKKFLTMYPTLIVKPSNSSGSKGLTRDITSLSALWLAIDLAGLESHSVLIQQQFVGEEIRFAVIGGKVQYALLREKAAVMGDGHTSLSKLIEEENKSRSNISDSMVRYPQIDATLTDEKNLHDERIVASGERVELSKSTMIRDGASVYDVTKTIHDDYIEAVERLASQFGPGFLAVDIMLVDYTAASSSTNYVILEINSNPALSLFYSCRDEAHPPIVENYLIKAFERVLDGWSS